MPKTIYVRHLAEQPNSNSHYLNRLIKLLNHFISIEPPKKIKGYESHHIVPKSWKPEWEFEKGNLLKVPAKAHYVIHHLMWKTFPSDCAMIKAFHQMNHRTDQKITAKIYEILRVEYSEIISNWNAERIKNKTHNFLGGEIQRKRVTNGTHHLLGGEIQRKRVTNGTHHLLGGEISRKITNERMIKGTHPSQIKKTCPNCGKTCQALIYGRWHGNRCKKMNKQ